MNLFFERKIDLNKKKQFFIAIIVSLVGYVLRIKFTLHHISASQKTFLCMQHLLQHDIEINIKKKKKKNLHDSFLWIPFISLNLFVPNSPFLTPWKHHKTLRFSDVFRGRETVH